MYVLLDVQHYLIELDCHQADQNQRYVHYPVSHKPEENVWKCDPHLFRVFVVHAFDCEDEDKQSEA